MRLLPNVPLHLAEVPIRLLPQRAVLLEGAARLLVVADLHLGKDAAHRAYGVRVPRGTTDEDLARLGGLLEVHQPDALWVVGDLIHHALGLTAETIAEVATWRRRYPVPLHLVPGNHDRPGSGWPPVWDLQIHPTHITVDGVQLCHAPDDVRSGGGLAVCGHVHPAVVLRSGADRLQVPCFWWTHQALVLPAFSDFTGGARVRPKRGDGCWAIVAERVVEVMRPPAGLPDYQSSSPSATTSAHSAPSARRTVRK